MGEKAYTFYWYYFYFIFVEMSQKNKWEPKEAVRPWDLDPILAKSNKLWEVTR